MIFLGAGASACFGIPTSPSLTDKILEILERDYYNLLNDIRAFLINNNKDFNYETILVILAALTDSSQVNRDHFSHLFVNANPDYKGDYHEIIDEIYEIICDCCTVPFEKKEVNYLEPEKLESIFNITYDTLIGIALFRGERQIIFSTNYDPSIELWCQKRFLNCLDGSKDIFSPEFKQVLQKDYLPNFLRSNTWQSNSAIALVRLHGSVWSYELRPSKSIKLNRPKQSILFSDLLQINKQKPTLIFPGQEEQLRRAQWGTLYDYFKEQLKGYCLFIGYSFRHEVINEPILDNLINGQIMKLGILTPDPSKNLENLFLGRNYPEEKIIEMPSEFGNKDALKQLGDKWFPLTLKMKFSNPDAVLEEAEKWVKERYQLYI